MENKIDKKNTADKAERQAALDPTRSFIVQAPAGSGKTELLVGRLLSLLSKVNAPEEVLAITFTRKAAYEMQARVLKFLKQAEKKLEENLEGNLEGNLNQKEFVKVELDGSDHQIINLRLAQKVLCRDKLLNWGLLKNPQRLNISTIDALCAKITAQIPVTARLGENFEVTDRPEDLYHQAVEHLLNSLNEKELTCEVEFNSILTRCLFYLDNRLDKFKKLITQMLASRASWLALLKYAYAGLEKKALENLIQEALMQVKKNLPSNHAEIIPDFFELNTLKDFQYLADQSLTDKNTVRKKIDKRQGFLPNTPEKSKMESWLAALEQEHADFLELLIKIRNYPTDDANLNSDLDSDLDSPSGATSIQWVQDWAMVLSRALGYLKIIFQEKKQIDFTEVALLAQEAVTSELPSEILLRLDHQISHLLVDEYQDTSKQQYEFLKALTSGWSPTDGRTLFLVGDPMQSIYRFREADVGLFLKTVEEGLGEIKLIFLKLKLNFRSTPQIIGWVNHCFSVLFPKKANGFFGAVEYAPSISGRESINQITNPNYSVGVEFLPTLSLDAMAMCLVEKLKPYQDINKNNINKNNINNSLDPLPKIAVLVRSRRHLLNILPVLSAHGIAYQGVEIENLKATPEILEILNLTKALYDTSDVLAWMSVLRSPVFGFTLSELFELKKLSSNFSNINILSALDKINTDLQWRAQFSDLVCFRVKNQLDKLKAILSHRGRDSVYKIIKRAWFGLGFNQIWSALAQQENIEVYLDLLKNLKPSHCLEKNGIGLEKLEQALESLYARPKANSCVEIMTIHKSKGLEFDHVFLLLPNNSNPLLEKPLLLWQDWVNSKGESEILMAPHRGKAKEDSALYRFLYALEKDREAMEFIRLLYVAATRAKNNLTLIGEVVLEEDDGQIKKPRQGSMMAGFWKVLDQSPDMLNYLKKMDEKNKENKKNKKNNPILELNSNADINILKQVPKDTTLGLELQKITHCNLNMMVRSQAEEVEVLDGSNKLNLPDVPEGDIFKRLLGQLAHEYFNQISKGRLGLDSSVDKAFLKTQARNLGLIPEDPVTEEIWLLGRNVLADPIGRWVLKESVESHSEWDILEVLSSKNSEPEKKIKEYRIDRFFKDEKTGEFILIDYKFSHPEADESWECFIEKERQNYIFQLKNYQRLVESLFSKNLPKNSPKDKNFNIRLGLYFPYILKLVWVV